MPNALRPSLEAAVNPATLGAEAEANVRGDPPALLLPPPGLALLDSDPVGRSNAERLALLLALLPVLLDGPLGSECELLGGDAERARDGGVCEGWAAPFCCWC
jgi:hypothetical protein